jgi:hypothetical protein
VVAAAAVVVVVVVVVIWNCICTMYQVVWWRVGGEFRTILSHKIVMFRFECKSKIFFGILKCSFCSVMLHYSLSVVTHGESMFI